MRNAAALICYGLVAVVIGLLCRSSDSDLLASIGGLVTFAGVVAVVGGLIAIAWDLTHSGDEVE